MTTMTKASSLMNIDNNSLLSDHITTDKEESTNKKTSDIASIILQQISMKINLLLQNQDKILQNQANLSVEVKDLRIKLEQQANKSAVPLPPPPPPNTSLVISEKTKKFSNHNNSVNEPKNIDNKQTMQEELQKKLNKIRDKSEQNENAVNSKPKDNGIPALEPEVNFKLRRTQSLCIKSKNNMPAPEGMKNEKPELSFAERKKMFETSSNG
jgi:hypothetical protein